MASAADAGGFGDRLRHLRLAAGLTQEELAERATLSTRGISDLERGARTAPQRETVRLLADALGLAGAERTAFIASVRRGPARISQEPADSIGPRWIGRAQPPLPRTTFVGRQRDIEATSAVLRAGGTRLLTLTGPGGVGKTRLALAIAARTAANFPDGTAFVDLAPLQDPRLLASTVVGTLGLIETGIQGSDELIKETLAGQRVLLILDNLEHLTGAGRWIAAFLAACPGPIVLATSRMRLRLAGEWEYPVSPLPLPDVADRGVESIAGSEAIRLFVVRARDVRPSFALSAENAATVAAICRRLDGLPLAIELAAARTRVLPLPSLLERLTHALPLLTRGAIDAPKRQQTVRDAIAWSYELLDESERVLFARLSVFAGGCTVQAAEAVCNPDGTVAVAVLDGIESLLDANLLRLEDNPAGEPRIRMLETVREFAGERLDARPESRAVRLAHAMYFLAFAEAGRPKLSGPEQAEWLDALQTEHDNLRLALDIFDAEGLGAEQLRLADALWGFWYLRGHLTEAAARLERALAKGDGAPDATRASALDGTGVITHSRRDDVCAIERFEAALALFRALGDQFGVAGVLDHLGTVLKRSATPDYAAAEELLRETLTIRRELGDNHAIAVSLNNIGNLDLLLGNYELAIGHYREAVESSRACGHRFVEALSLGNLAMGIREMGDHGMALRLYRETIALVQALGDGEGITNCLCGIARIAIAEGRTHDGMKLFGAAEKLREEIGLWLEPVDQTQLDAAIASAREALGAKASTAAWAEGRTLTVDDAVAAALELPPINRRLTTNS